MPLKPDEVHDYATTSRHLAFQEACGDIDKQLMGCYDGKRPMSIFLSLGAPDKDPVLLQMIKAAYAEAGWTISVCQNGCKFEEADQESTRTFEMPDSMTPYR